MHKNHMRLLISLIFSGVLIAPLAYSHPEDACDCDAPETVDILPTETDVTETTEVVEIATDTVETLAPEQALATASEASDVTEVAELVNVEEPTVAVETEQDPKEALNPEYYGESGLPIYTVQVIAVDHKRKAPVRARVVPKFYGPAEIIIEKTKNPKAPKVYTIIAGRFEGYTPAKEAAVKLCEPIFLNGCFVRRWEDVDSNRWVEPEKPADETQ